VVYPNLEGGEGQGNGTEGKLNQKSGGRGGKIGFQESGGENKKQTRKKKHPL